MLKVLKRRRICLPALHLLKRVTAGITSAALSAGLHFVTQKLVLFPLCRVSKGNAAGILHCIQDDRYGEVSFLIERRLRHGSFRMTGVVSIHGWYPILHVKAENYVCRMNARLVVSPAGSATAARDLRPAGLVAGIVSGGSLWAITFLGGRAGETPAGNLGPAGLVTGIVSGRSLRRIVSLAGWAWVSPAGNLGPAGLVAGIVAGLHLLIIISETGSVCRRQRGLCAGILIGGSLRASAV